jgi:hypothetical protein
VWKRPALNALGSLNVLSSAGSAAVPARSRHMTPILDAATTERIFIGFSSWLVILLA